MNKLLSILLGFVLLAGTAYGSTVSGTIKDGSSVVQGLGTVKFNLIGCPVSQMTGTVMPVTPSYTFTAASDGTWSGTVIGNDLITCPAGGATQYTVSQFTSTGILLRIAQYTLTDANSFSPDTGSSTVTPSTPFLSNPLTTVGDLLIGGLAGVPSRLAMGPGGSCLKSNGATIFWDTVCGSGGSTPSTLALAAPSDFSVGDPVTGTGALSFNWVIAPSTTVVNNSIVKRDSAGSTAVHILTLDLDPTSNLQAATKHYVDTSSTTEHPGNKNIPNGYAGLDGTGLVPTANLPFFFPATNGVVFNTSRFATRNAVFTDITALWAGGACAGTEFLRNDGECSSFPLTTLNGTTGSFTLTGPGVSQTSNTFTFSGGGGAVGAAGSLQVSDGSGSLLAATTKQVNAGIGKNVGTHVVGDSISCWTGAFAINNGDSAINNGYAELLKNPIGGPFINTCNPGDQAADSNYKFITRAINPVGSSADPVYIIENGTNDAVYYLNDTNKQHVFNRIYLANIIIPALPSSSKVLTQSCTLAGGFTADTAPLLVGMGVTATTNAATATCTISSPKASDSLYACYLLDDASAGSFTIKIDGTLQNDPFNGTTTWSSKGDAGVALATHNGITQAIGCARFTGFAAGTHTIIFTNTGTTGGTNTVRPQFVAAAPVSVTSNPYVIAVSPNQQNTSSAGSPYAATYAGFVSSIITNTASDGLNTIYADTSNALLNSPSCGNGVQATMFSVCYSDSLHPNNIGHSVMAAAVLAVIPSAKVLGTNTWNSDQMLKNYIPSFPTSPYQFFNINPFNLLGDASHYGPGIVFQGANGQLTYVNHSGVTGLTFAYPAGTNGFAFCPWGGNSQISGVPPTLASCSILGGNGFVDMFQGTFRTQGNANFFGASSTTTVNGIFKMVNTANGANSVASTAVATSTVNGNSPCFAFIAGVWDAIGGVPGFQGPCLKAVPITPTPGGNSGSVYLTLSTFNTPSYGLDLSSANLINKLGTASIVGGTIDGTVIGGTSTAAGHFASLTASSGAASSYTALVALAASLSTGATIGLTLGSAQSTNNQGGLYFSNNGGTGSTTNTICMGIQGQQPVCVDGTGSLFIPALSGTPGLITIGTAGKVLTASVTGTGSPVLAVNPSLTNPTVTHLNVGSTASGFAVIPSGTAGGSPIGVSATSVTASSIITVTEDRSIATVNGVSCNTTATSSATQVVVTSRTVGVGFTIAFAQSSGNIILSNACFDYTVTN